MSAEAPDPIGGGGFRYQSFTRRGRAQVARPRSRSSGRAAQLPATDSPSGRARRTRPRLTSVSSGEDTTT